jgi:hypothetical protein
MISLIQIFSAESPTLHKILTSYVEFRGSHIINDIGACSLTLTEDQASGIPLQPDLRIVPVLSDGLYTHMFRTYLLSGWEWRQEGSTRYLTLQGLCANSLLSRRIVAWPAGTLQSKKNAAADDMIRIVVDENLTSAQAGTDRNISSYGVKVESYFSLADAVELSFAWQKLSDAVNKIVETAFAVHKQRIVWDFVPQGDGWNVLLTVRKDGFRDRRAGQPNELVIDETLGNISEVVSSYDRRGSSNYIYGGDQDTGVDRMIRKVSDSIDISKSPIARAEAFYNGVNCNTESELIHQSSARLAELAPVTKYQVKLLEGPELRYGRDIQVGDLITIAVFGQHDVLVRSAQISRTADDYSVDLTLEEV